MSTHLTVTAHLDGPTVGLVEQPVMLDGPLAWAAAMDARARGIALEPITRAHAPDLPLPLARWEQAGTWGWCTSAAVVDVASHTASEIRRKPATAQMARFARDRKHHSGLGPYKARDTTIPVAWVRDAVWQVAATDRERLEALLALITHLGANARLGYGRIRSWGVEPGPVDGWRERPLPGPDMPRQAYRAPYWHATRKVTT